MSDTQPTSLLWWVIPGVLAGMPMPFVHPDRRMAGGGDLAAFEDDLSVLYSAGVRAVVSLLNIPSDAQVYKSAGFSFICLPVADGGAPSLEQADDFVRFIQMQRSAERPVAVHCEAGIGRTGTLLATYLIAEGETAAKAIERVRAVEKVAIETSRQIHFLVQYAGRVHQKSTQEAYTKDELIHLVVDALPVRGEKCPKCGVVIPRFADLTEKDEARLRRLISEGRKIMAMQELRSLTLCPVSWAKIWILHSGRPDATGATAPCPYCGKPLKTALAKQCPHCNMDWHNPENPKRLGHRPTNP